MVDCLSHHHQADEQLKQQSCYGQLQYLLQLDLPLNNIVNQDEALQLLLLAMIYEAKVV